MRHTTHTQDRLAQLIGRYARFEFQRLMNFGDNEQELEWPTPRPDSPMLLYLHVPFCEVLCPFCSFHRVQFKEEKARNYFKALRREYRLVTERGFKFNEIYVGGGTPTVMPRELATTLDEIVRDHPVMAISSETNPNDLKTESLVKLRDAGVNRLSVGVQSFDNQLLKEMDRLEKYGNADQICKHLDDIQGLFDTLNIDMIFNFPRQTEESLQNDLKTLTDRLGADQVSFYPLMTSPSTDRPLRAALGRVEHGREHDLYRQITEHMLSNGYHRSSAWCFSRNTGQVDEYIAEQEEYLGLGSGSFGFLDGSLYANTFSINHYQKMLGMGKTACVRQRRMSTREQARYHMLMRLFGGSMSLPDAEKTFDGQFKKLLRKELMGLRLIKAIRIEGDQVHLTEQGQYLWVVLMREFFTGVNRFRDQMRHHISDESDDLLKISLVEEPARQ